jgi:hypothetical protein
MFEINEIMGIETIFKIKRHVCFTKTPYYEK